MSYLTYLIFRKAGNDITKDRIDWSVYINDKNKNKIQIIAIDYKTAYISYIIYKEKDTFNTCQMK